jgi:hypothetical protein
VAVTFRMRGSDNFHARAVSSREHFPLVFETAEHLSRGDSAAFGELLPRLRERFGRENLLESHSAKDPHHFSQGNLLVSTAEGATVTMERASHFIRHLQRIDRYRIYARPEIREEVTTTLRRWWPA